MVTLSTRIRVPESSLTSSEDILSDSFETIYPDQYRNLHGDPGSEIIYDSPRFGDIHLSLADTHEQGDHFLFAHYLWNASLQLSEYITQDSDVGTASERGGSGEVKETVWSVKGEKMLEVGAGR